MISGRRRWCAFWLLVRVVGWLSWMAWGQAVAFQGTVAVVYPETDEPAYRVVFESVIQGIRNRIGPSQIQTYALAAATKAPGALKAWLGKQTTARAAITLGRGAYEHYQAAGITLPAVSGLLDLSPQLNPTANGISLSVDPALFFETLKQVLPDTSRVHVVYNPAKDQWLIDLARKAAPRYQLELDCPRGVGFWPPGPSATWSC